MAAPNILGLTTATGKTTYLTPSATTAVVLLQNAASSNTVLKINQIVAANVNGTNAVDCTVAVYTNGGVAQGRPLRVALPSRLRPQSQSRLMLR